MTEMGSIDWKSRIDDAREIPHVRGTSIAVQLVVDAIAEGWSIERLLTRFPELAEADIRACVACAGDAMRRTVFVRLVREGLAEAKMGLVVPDEDLDEFFGAAEPGEEEP